MTVAEEGKRTTWKGISSGFSKHAKKEKMLLFSPNPLTLNRQEWTAAVTYYGEMTRDEEEWKSSLRDKSSLLLIVLLSAASTTRPVCLPD